VSLNAGSHYLYRQHANHFNAAEENSAIDVVYFVGEVAGASDEVVCDTVHREAMLNLLVQMVRQLRNEITEFYSFQTTNFPLVSFVTVNLYLLLLK